MSAWQPFRLPGLSRADHRVLRVLWPPCDRPGWGRLLASGSSADPASALPGYLVSLGWCPGCAGRPAVLRHAWVGPLRRIRSPPMASASCAWRASTFEIRPSAQNSGPTATNCRSTPHSPRQSMIVIKVRSNGPLMAGLRSLRIRPYVRNLIKKARERSRGMPDVTQVQQLYGTIKAQEANFLYQDHT